MAVCLFHNHPHTYGSGGIHAHVHSHKEKGSHTVILTLFGLAPLLLRTALVWCMASAVRAGSCCCFSRPYPDPAQAIEALMVFAAGNDTLYGTAQHRLRAFSSTSCSRRAGTLHAWQLMIGGPFYLVFLMAAVFAAA